MISMSGLPVSVARSERRRSGFTTSVGSEYGGLGSNIQFWREEASIGMTF
jgi:hypothetical protein